MKIRFIVLIDFSDHSEWLLTFSNNWALRTGAELSLVHFAADPIPGLGDGEVLSGMKRDSEERTIEKLKSFADGIIDNHGHIKYYAGTYNVPSAVMKLKEPDTVDYLFVGMNDRTGIEKLINTSTALQLRDHIDNIMIALPTAVSNFHFNNLYVGIKESYPLNEQRFEELLYVMSNQIKNINFFSVLKNTSSRDKVTAYLEILCAKYGEKIPTSYSTIEANNTAAAIMKYMQDNKGILVVQKGPRNIMDIFRKFFTTEIVHHAQIPVIILP